MNIANKDTVLNKAIELANSSLFDVHTWSEYGEVNKVVDKLYKQLKVVKGFGVNSSVRKKHVKVVILDLYVKWLTDPFMYSSYYRAHWYYRDINGRYNKLYISRITIKVVDGLKELGYLTSVTGHYGRSPGYTSHMARMRATEKLISFLEENHITPNMVERASDTECILMRDWDEDAGKQVNVPYEDEDFPEVVRWRTELTAYNNLLRSTYIDIPSFPEDGLVTKDQRDRYSTKGKKFGPSKIHINHHQKFVKRIFNNNGWEQGGRFYGGWWQRVPSEWRQRIRIGNMPVSEIDYKGLHIVLLYLMQGLEYRDDPYLLEGQEVSDRMRSLLKQILLTSINAADKGTAVQGIKMEINFNPEEYSWIRDKELDISELIDAFVEKHAPIQEYFFSNSGIRLQNIDARIAELVILHFTRLGVPVLCVHDSFVISADQAEELKNIMSQSFLTVAQELELPVFNPSTKQLGLEIGQWAVILSNPDWRDVRNGFIQEQYDHPKWYKRLEEFKKIEFKDYYCA